MSTLLLCTLPARWLGSGLAWTASLPEGSGVAALRAKGFRLPAAPAPLPAPRLLSHRLLSPPAFPWPPCCGAPYRDAAGPEFCCMMGAGGGAFGSGGSQLGSGRPFSL